MNYFRYYKKLGPIAKLATSYKTEQMHDLVIGLFMNRYEFGRAL